MLANLKVSKKAQVVTACVAAGLVLAIAAKAVYDRGQRRKAKEVARKREEEELESRAHLLPSPDGSSSVQGSAEGWFYKASVHARKLNAKNMTLEDRLSLYKFFKQATAGPCTAAAPSRLDIGDYAKWEAWKSCGNLGRVEAMAAYVSLVDRLSPGWQEKYAPVTVPAGQEAAAPAGEDAEGAEDDDGGPSWISMSKSEVSQSLLEEEKAAMASLVTEEDKAAQLPAVERLKALGFDAEKLEHFFTSCQTGDMEAVAALLEECRAAAEQKGKEAQDAHHHHHSAHKAGRQAQQDLVNVKNEAGESCLHAAADGGSAEVLEALLSAGADPAVTEPAGGQTPLHYAAALGNAPAAMMLLSRGAPLDAVDSSGATAASLADEPEMREVFSTFLAERKAKAEGQAGSKKDEAGGAALQADV